MRLLCIIPDYLSAIVDKGEIQPCYYNPGELADEVHILMTNSDSPPLEPLQYMVGRAKLFVHNLPEDDTIPTKALSFLTPWRLRRWAAPGVALIKKIQPDLIRCHGADWNAYLAAQAKIALGIPYCVSVHTHVDKDSGNRIYFEPEFAWQKKSNVFYETMAYVGLVYADRVLPVYENILSYLFRLGIAQDKIRVCYNVLNKHNISQKNDYALHDPARILYVGRLTEAKNPISLIQAMKDIENAVLTVIGTGDYKNALERAVSELHIEDRVRFIDSMPNDALCKTLPEHDIFAIHCDCLGISKTTLEAMLTGLPIVINRRADEQVTELQDDLVHFVENTPDSYRQALVELLTNDRAREALGRHVCERSRALYHPEITEKVYVDIYRELIGSRAAARS